MQIYILYSIMYKLYKLIQKQNSVRKPEIGKKNRNRYNNLMREKNGTHAIF